MFKGFLTFSLLMLIASCQNEPKQELPQILLENILELERGCFFDKEKKVFYETKTDLSKIQKIDINNDGIVEYIISDSDVYCEAGYSFRHGNGGFGITIFSDLGNGEVVKSFDLTVFGLKFEENPKILLGGIHCGQRPPFPKSEMMACEKELIWNLKLRKFEIENE